MKIGDRVIDAEFGNGVIISEGFMYLLIEFDAKVVGGHSKSNTDLDGRCRWCLAGELMEAVPKPYNSIW